MATNFPGSIDSFTNPTSGDTLDSPSHAAQHANINDAMVAVQTRLGAQSGTIGTWTTYTPTWTGTGGTPTVGNGTLVGYYTQLNDLVFVRLRLTWGSTTSATSITEWRFSYPSGLSPANVAGVHEIGSAAVLDSGTAIYRSVAVDVAGSGIGFYAGDGGPTVGSLNPMTWTTNDQVTATLTYQVA